ncbi:MULTISPECIES: chorismate mutase [Francisella]|uniref:chorismate mutase n=2 Tax=Francisella TaxID=262 RepID=A0AAJ4NQ69_9GAMM|nr:MULTISPECIES: chorismate mutase [Francisella]QEO56810.1 chorismate mutase [Francisella marina]QEO59072.1 chorismate mutase [Francisella marina]QWV00115.1 chorismate mutase [Francisella salimarina]
MKKYLLMLVSISIFGMSFAMTPSSFIAKPTPSKYESEIMHADEQIIKSIAERQELRSKMLDLQKEQNLPDSDPFQDKDLEATRTNFAIEYNVNPKLVDEIFSILNSPDQNTPK